MIRFLLNRPTTDGKVYAVIAGLSTDIKPTAGLITGSRFVEADTGAAYLFDETAGEWNENQQLTASVQAYFEDHPEAIDQAAIEAMFGDQLDGIEEDVGGLKSAFESEIGSNNTYAPTYNTITGKTISSSGGAVTVVDSSTMDMTDYIPVSTGDIIKYYKAGTALGNAAFFDSNKSPINGSAFTVPTTETSKTVAEGQAYVAFSGIPARLANLVLTITHTVEGAVYTAIESKLDKNQTAQNAGKVMRVDSSGNLEADAYIPVSDVTIVQSGWAGASTKPQSYYANCKGIDLAQGDTITPKTGYECALMDGNGTTKVSWFSSAYTAPSAVGNYGIIIRKTGASAEVVLASDGYLLTDYIEETYSTKNADYTGVVVNDPTRGMIVSDAVGLATKTRWYGKKAAFVGDSITAGAQAGSGPLYYQIINSDIHFGSVTVDAVAGSGFSAIGTDKTPIITRAANLATDLDLIVVFAGTNDFGHSVPIGSLTDTTDISFCGAVAGTILEILDNNPDVRLVMMTPLHRASGTYDGEDDVNTQGKVLLDYVDALISVCRKYSIPIIDTYAISGMNPNVPDIGTDYFADGLHLNAAGHQKLAESVIPYIKLQ